jgi:hypothetical protein
MFVDVHCGVNPVALFATCRHICKLTTVGHIAGYVHSQSDPPVSPDRDWLGILAVVHCAVNQVALFATCKHICILTTHFYNNAWHNPAPG